MSRGRCAKAQKIRAAKDAAACDILVSVGNGSGDSDEDIVVRSKADATVLRPDERVPASPVL
jgi:hypothetical protein